MSATSSHPCSSFNSQLFTFQTFPDLTISLLSNLVAIILYSSFVSTARRNKQLALTLSSPPSAPLLPSFIPLLHLGLVSSLLQIVILILFATICDSSMVDTSPWLSSVNINNNVLFCLYAFFTTLYPTALVMLFFFRSLSRRSLRLSLTLSLVLSLLSSALLTVGLNYLSLSQTRDFEFLMQVASSSLLLLPSLLLCVLPTTRRFSALPILVYSLAVHSSSLTSSLLLASSPALTTPPTPVTLFLSLLQHTLLPPAVYLTLSRETAHWRSHALSLLDPLLDHPFLIDHAFLSLDHQHVLGRGSTSSVVRGRLALWWSLRPSMADVAVKVMTPPELTPESIAEFTREFVAWGQLSKLAQQMDPPPLVRFFGISVMPPHLSLVFELVPDGSLQDHVAILPSEHRKPIAQDCLNAISFLHAHRFLHRDVKLSNFLLSSNNRALLTDLGTSQPFDAPGDLDLVGTLEYMAPELVETYPPHYSTATDVHALAVCLYAILSGGQLPYAATRKPFQIRELILARTPPYAAPPAASPLRALYEAFVNPPPTLASLNAAISLFD